MNGYATSNCRFSNLSLVQPDHIIKINSFPSFQEKKFYIGFLRTVLDLMELRATGFLQSSSGFNIYLVPRSMGQRKLMVFHMACNFNHSGVTCIVSGDWPKLDGI